MGEDIEGVAVGVGVDSGEEGEGGFRGTEILSIYNLVLDYIYRSCVGLYHVVD